MKIALAVGALTLIGAGFLGTASYAALRPAGPPVVAELPACVNDAPDVETSPDCVWFDEGFYKVVHDGRETNILACPVEDATGCVWDTHVDGPRRFLVIP